MKRGYLSEYFSGVAVKKLSAVEADPDTSNQHEFNGSAELKRLFGLSDQKSIPTRFLWIGAEQESPDAVEGWLSWYDARRNHPTRSEYRLYYQGNEVTRMMREDDSFFVAIRQDGSCLVIITPSESTMFNQLVGLFGIDDHQQLAFNYQPVDAEHDAELDFIARTILEALEIEPEEPETDILDSLIEPFGVDMPRPAALSELARQSVGLDLAVDDPDAALLLWMERETQLFRRIERRLVADRIAEGFGARGMEDVDGFISFSLSVQNRRKSRAGLALESHIEAMLQANSVSYSRGAVTENGNRPDFLFPGVEAYQDPAFPESKLVMLGAKSTLKERWRQVLSEATRIHKKHLLTLEPGISEAQTSEMKAKSLQLVLPFGLHRTYKPQQQTWLIGVSDFLTLVKSRQSE